MTKRQRQPKQLRRSISNASSSAAVNAGMPEVEELRSLLEKGDISVLFSQEELNDCPRLSSSLVHLPTYITSEEVQWGYECHGTGQVSESNLLLTEQDP